jgi:hypothetical protein
VPLSDIVNVVVSTTGAGVTRPGYGVPGILGYPTGWSELSRTYASISAVGEDFAVNTPEYMAASAVFSQQPRVRRLKILRGANKPTQAFSVGVQLVATQIAYQVRVAIATGVAWKSQTASYNPGNGATGWVPSNTWSQGDLVVADGDKIYSNLGPSGFGFTGIGAASGPSGTLAAIREGGVYWMFVGTGGTGAVSNDSIINGVKTKIDVLDAPPVVGTGIGQLTSAIAGSAGSRTLTLTANQTARFFGLQVLNRSLLNGAQNHADPGVATDLNNVVDEDNDWYGLVTLYNSEALGLAAAAWVETHTKLYPVATMDTAVARVASASATDIAEDIKDNAYARSWAFFHSSNDEFADAAELGRFFPINPGGETWRLKTMRGVEADELTGTEIVNLTAKRAHWYYTLGGVNVVGGEAKTGSGEYVDVTRGIDWYTSELQAKLANLLIGENKVPFTNAGIAQVEAKVVQQNLAGIAAGLIAPDPAPVVTVPDVADISTEDKLDRTLTGVTSEWTLAGAIHEITVTVTANP